MTRTKGKMLFLLIYSATESLQSCQGGREGGQGRVKRRGRGGMVHAGIGALMAMSIDSAKHFLL